MKKVFVILIFVIFSPIFCKAQFVTIPDTAFVSWLKSNGYDSCMNGNQMDTTCPAILNAISVHCIHKNVKDLSGIQYFKKLDTLICNNDSLISLPFLPPSLKWFKCDANYLTTLPSFPSSLTYLDCTFDPLKKLPSLPSSLLYLYCDYTGLTSLPSLPASLIVIQCASDSLVNLPSLPSSLEILLCDRNHLTSLPELPSLLNNLNCSDNSLINLPAFPSYLTNLICDADELTSLPMLPEYLSKFDCSNNPNLKCLLPFPGVSITSFEIANTGIKCLPNKILHPLITSLPAIDTMPICNSTYNPNDCGLIASAPTVTASTFNIFPNPTNDLLFISGNFSTGEIDVRDLLGKLLIEQSVNNSIKTSSIDVSRLAKGIYFVSLYSNGQNTTKKIIKD